MTEMTIRRATPEDAEALAEIGAETFTDTFSHLYPEADLQAFLVESHSVEAARGYLENPDYAVWLAEEDGRAVGYALAGPCGLPHPDVTAGCGELKRIYFRKTAQGGGRGGRLLDAVLAWLEKNGPRPIWLGVWSENHGAQKFYAARGFEKVGEYEFPVGTVRDHEFILRRG